MPPWAHLAPELRRTPYLSEEERAHIDAKSNKPTQILSLQSTQLRELKMRGLIEDFRHRIGQELQASYPLVGRYLVWLSVPFSAMVMWVFHTMERIGRISENPFESKSTEIPITTISRGIEIDLREMLNETPASIPAPIEPQHDTQT